MRKTLEAFRTLDAVRIPDTNKAQSIQQVIKWMLSKLETDTFLNKEREREVGREREKEHSRFLVNICKRYNKVPLLSYTHNSTFRTQE